MDKVLSLSEPSSEPRESASPVEPQSTQIAGESLKLLPCPRCGGDRSVENGDTGDRLCAACREHPEMLRLDILIRTAPERLNDKDFPELSKIRKYSRRLLETRVVLEKGNIAIGNTTIAHEFASAMISERM
jgi:hypothetical protein